MQVEAQVFAVSEVCLDTGKLIPRRRGLIPMILPPFNRPATVRLGACSASRQAGYVRDRFHRGARSLSRAAGQVLRVLPGTEPRETR
jgi:hypothetical protein